MSAAALTATSNATYGAGTSSSSTPSAAAASSAAAVDGGAAAADGATPSSASICRYFLRGICRFGPMCRFSHDVGGGEELSFTNADGTEYNNDQQPSTSSRPNWANAPIFVPSRMIYNDDEGTDLNSSTAGAVGGAASNKSWAEVVGAGTSRMSVIPGLVNAGSAETVCPYESPCPYGPYCAYTVHLELCKMCDQHCLHPTDTDQRRNHNKECLQQHEQAMELSFAIARSKDKTCGICFDTIMEKAGREKRFGILPNCSHIFCLECIRKWRQAKQFEHKITRSCPECRVSSDFVCPSAFWVETKEEKDKLLTDYRSALGIKDCKYFKKGDGKCPFGNKCFYKHALPNGELVDVGCPKRARRLHRANEMINLLDIYLWEYVDQRDYHWFDILSSGSDDSDDSD